jgi:hypothetical protein
MRIGDSTYTLRVRESGGGDYVRYKYIDMKYSNTVGFRATGQHVEFYNCNASFSGREGFHFSRNGLSPLSAGYDFAWRCLAYKNNAGGDGYGQGFTDEAPFSWFIFCLAKQNGMAGFDFLDFNSSTNVSYSGILFSESDTNAQSPKTATVDPGIYVDGANHIFIFGNKVHGEGLGTRVSGSNFGDGIRINNEHPTTKTVSDIWVVNNLSYNNTGTAFRIDVDLATYTVGGIYAYFNTFIQGPSPAYSTVQFIDLSGAGLVFKNNIVQGSGAPIVRWLSSASAQCLHSDYNVWWRPSGTNVYDLDSVSYTLPQWQALSYAQDAHSIFQSPSFVNSASDWHLQAGSPAIDFADVTAYSAVAFAAGSSYAGNMAGTTRTDNAHDDVLVHPDAGYHYFASQTKTEGLTVGKGTQS